jgi:hypothetical protein
MELSSVITAGHPSITGGPNGDRSFENTFPNCVRINAPQAAQNACSFGVSLPQFGQIIV